ncbi:hypothetical protein [Streptomyces sp. NPDC003393]
MGDCRKLWPDTAGAPGPKPRGTAADSLVSRASRPGGGTDREGSDLTGSGGGCRPARHRAGTDRSTLGHHDTVGGLVSASDGHVGPGAGGGRRRSLHTSHDDGVCHAALGTLDTLGTHVTLGTLQTEVTLSTLGTHVTLSTLGTHVTLDTLGTHVTLDTLRPDVTLDTLRTQITLSTLRTNGADVTGDALEALRTLKTGGTLRTLRTRETGGTGGTLRTLWTLGTGQAGRTGGTLRAHRTSGTRGTRRTGLTLEALRTLGTGVTLGALRAHVTLNTLRTLGTGGAGVTGVTLEALRTLNTGVALNSGHALGTLRTLGTGQAGRTGGTLRAHRTSGTAGTRRTGLALRAHRARGTAGSDAALGTGGALDALRALLSGHTLEALRTLRSRLSVAGTHRTLRAHRTGVTRVALHALGALLARDTLWARHTGLTLRPPRTGVATWPLRPTIVVSMRVGRGRLVPVGADGTVRAGQSRIAARAGPVDGVGDGHRARSDIEDDGKRARRNHGGRSHTRNPHCSTAH